MKLIFVCICLSNEPSTRGPTREKRVFHKKYSSVTNFFITEAQWTNGKHKNALQYNNDRKSFDLASKDCHMKGTQLVKIDTVSKYKDVQNLMRDYGKDVWIDMRSVGSYYDIYYHSDGERATFFQWDNDEPNMQETDRCVRISGQTLKYRTWTCNSEYNYICDTDHDTTTMPQESSGYSGNEDSFSVSYKQDTATFSHESSTHSGNPVSNTQVTYDMDTLSGTSTERKVETGTYTRSKYEKSASVVLRSETTSTGKVGSTSPTETTQSLDTVTGKCGVCECHVNFINLNDPDFKDIMKERVQKIKMALSLNRSDLSKTLRKKISAADVRMSSKLLGYVGIVFLGFTFCIIVIPDAIKVVYFLKNKTRRN